MTFDMLPNKIKREPSKVASPEWPDFGNAFELNEFYRLYESCAGEMGEGYIFFWSTEEIADYEPTRVEFYPATWRIFASNGGACILALAPKPTNRASSPATQSIQPGV